MAQFQKLKSKARENEEIRRKLWEIYSRGTLIDVRDICAAIIEDPMWGLLQRPVVQEPERRKTLGLELYKRLVIHLQNKAVEPSLHTWSEIKLKESYGSDPVKLYDDLARYLAEEQKLLAMPTNQIAPSSRAPATCVPPEPRSEAGEVSAILVDTTDIQNMLRHLQDIQSRFQGSQSVDYGDVLTELDRLREQLKAKICKMWSVIDQWLTEVKRSYIPYRSPCGVPRPALPAHFEELCTLGNLALVTLKEVVDRTGHDYQSSGDEKISRLSGQVRDLLDKHLSRIFIFEDQPERITNTFRDRVTKFDMSARILGASGLVKCQVSPPGVMAQVYHERDVGRAIQSGEAHMTSFRVHNGEAAMNPQMLKVHFKEVSLIEQRRRPQEGKTRSKKTLVAGQKHNMVLMASLVIGKTRYYPRARSLPVVLITQASQTWGAWGTIFWNAAFSDETSAPAVIQEEKEEVAWRDLQPVLSEIFKRLTDGLEIQQDQLCYLGHKLLGASPNEDIHQRTVSKDLFIKRNMTDLRFSFWKWFYACANLVRQDFLSDLWKKRLIYGFIDKEGAKGLLEVEEPGTFLLRFREGAIEETQSAKVCAHLAVCVVEQGPLTGKIQVFHINKYLKVDNIRQNRLCDVIKGMEISDKGIRKPLLRRLYPNMSPEELVPARSNDAVGDDGYLQEDSVAHKYLITLERESPASRLEVGGAPHNGGKPESPWNHSETMSPPSECIGSPPSLWADDIVNRPQDQPNTQSYPPATSDTHVGHMQFQENSQGLFVTNGDQLTGADPLSANPDLLSYPGPTSQYPGTSHEYPADLIPLLHGNAITPLGAEESEMLTELQDGGSPALAFDTQIGPSPAKSTKQEVYLSCRDGVVPFLMEGGGAGLEKDMAVLQVTESAAIAFDDITGSMTAKSTKQEVQF